MKEKESKGRKIEMRKEKGTKMEQKGKKIMERADRTCETMIVKISQRLEPRIGLMNHEGGSQPFCLALLFL